jgi:hypothetical protein
MASTVLVCKYFGTQKTYAFQQDQTKYMQLTDSPNSVRNSSLTTGAIKHKHQNPPKWVIHIGFS